jgi:hypothetical protein
MSLSPNPASEQVTLTLADMGGSQPVELAFYSLSGQLMYSKKVRAPGRHEERVDLRDLPRGVYVVAAKVGGARLLAEKLVVD